MGSIGINIPTIPNPKLRNDNAINSFKEELIYKLKDFLEKIDSKEFYMKRDVF